MENSKAISLAYELLYTIPICIAAVLLGEPALRFDSSAGDVMIALAVCGLCATVKKLKIRGLLIMTGIILAPVIGILLFVDSEKISLILQEKWVWLAVGMGVASFIVGLLVVDFRKIRLALSGIAIVGLVLIVVFRQTTKQVGIVMVLFLLLLSALDEIQLNWKKKGYPDRKSHMVFIAPFVVVLVAGLSAVKAPDTPYQWGFVRNIASFVGDVCKSISEKISLHTSEDYFEKNRIGFSDRGSLGGDISYSDEIELSVECYFNTTPEFYLEGKKFDTFNGREWTLRGDYDYSNLLDIIELYAAINNYADADRDFDIVKRFPVDITYDEMKSEYAFVPEKGMLRQSELDAQDMYYNSGNVRFNSVKGYKNTYSVTYCVLNRGGSLYNDFLGTKSRISRENWNNTVRKLGLIAENGCSYNDYLAYREMIYSEYAKRPEISDMARELLNNICDGCDNDVDRLLRIEALLSCFEYTENPGNLPQEIDSEGEFLDYMLFTNQKGYCSYFATAFSIMARAEGIPVRYVQGYYVPKSDAKTRNVLSGMAHGWPEAYIDGIGWITFDPTPGYGEEATGWNTDAENAEIAKRMKEMGINPYKLMEEREYDIPERITTDADENDEETSQVKWYYIVIPAGCCLGFILLIFFFDRLLIAYRFKRLDKEKKAKKICRRNIKLLGYLGFAMEEGETLEEFSKRAATRLPGELMEFISCYERLSYSTVTDIDVIYESVVKNNDELRAFVKKKNRIGYIRYLIKRE